MMTLQEEHTHMFIESNNASERIVNHYFIKNLFGFCLLAHWGSFQAEYVSIWWRSQPKILQYKAS